MALSIVDHTHFNLQRVGEKLTMCTKIPGISMILFWTKDCEFCGELKDIIKELPNRVPNMKFGTCNIGISARGQDGNVVDKPVHRMCMGSTTPINHVPFMISYINNKPYKIYEGERTMSHVIKFVSSILADVQRGPSKAKTQDDGAIETYGAIPKGRAKRCYLTVESAYGGGAPQGAGGSSGNKGGSYALFTDAYGIADGDIEDVKGMEGRT
jgi:hypothetical protein